MHLSIDIPDWVIVLVVGIWLLKLMFRGAYRLGEYFEKIEPMTPTDKGASDE